MDLMSIQVFGERTPPSWLTGQIKAVLQPKGFGFIRPECELPNGLGYRDVYFRLNKAQGEVQEGDLVLFMLKDFNTDKPSAQIVRKVGFGAEEQIKPGNRRRTRSEVRQRTASSHRSLTPTSIIGSNGRRLSVAPLSFEDFDIDSKSQSSDVHSVNSDRADATKAADGSDQPGTPQRRARTSKEDFINQFGQLKGRIVKIALPTVTILAKTNPSDSGNVERRLFHVSQSAIPSGHLLLEVDDEVTFTRSQMKRELAINVTLAKCSRTVEKLERYLGDLLHRVHDISDSRSRNLDRKSVV